MAFERAKAIKKSMQSPDDAELYDAQLIALAINELKESKNAEIQDLYSRRKESKGGHAEELKFIADAKAIAPLVLQRVKEIRNRVDFSGDGQDRIHDYIMGQLDLFEKWVNDNNPKILQERKSGGLIFPLGREKPKLEKRKRQLENSLHVPESIEDMVEQVEQQKKELNQLRNVFYAYQSRHSLSGIPSDPETVSGLRERINSAQREMLASNAILKELRLKQPSENKLKPLTPDELKLIAAHKLELKLVTEKIDRINALERLHTELLNKITLLKTKELDDNSFREELIQLNRLAHVYLNTVSVTIVADEKNENPNADNPDDKPLYHWIKPFLPVHSSEENDYLAKIETNLKESIDDQIDFEKLTSNEPDPEKLNSLSKQFQRQINTKIASIQENAKKANIQENDPQKLAKQIYNQCPSLQVDAKYAQDVIDNITTYLQSPRYAVFHHPHLNKCTPKQLGDMKREAAGKLKRRESKAPDVGAGAGPGASPSLMRSNTGLNPSPDASPSPAAGGSPGLLRQPTREAKIKNERTEMVEGFERGLMGEDPDANYLSLLTEKKLEDWYRKGHAKGLELFNRFMQGDAPSDQKIEKAKKEALEGLNRELTAESNAERMKKQKSFRRAQSHAGAGAGAGAGAPKTHPVKRSPSSVSDDTASITDSPSLPATPSPSPGAGVIKLPSAGSATSHSGGVGTPSPSNNAAASPEPDTHSGPVKTTTHILAAINKRSSAKWNPKVSTVFDSETVQEIKAGAGAGPGPNIRVPRPEPLPSRSKVHPRSSVVVNTEPAAVPGSHRADAGAGANTETEHPHEVNKDKSSNRGP